MGGGGGGGYSGGDSGLVAGGAGSYNLGLNPYGYQTFGPTWPPILANGNNRRFIQNNTCTSDIDKSVSGSKIYGKISGKHSPQLFKHYGDALNMFVKKLM